MKFSETFLLFVLAVCANMQPMPPPIPPSHLPDLPNIEVIIGEEEGLTDVPPAAYEEEIFNFHVYCPISYEIKGFLNRAYRAGVSQLPPWMREDEALN